MKKKLLIGLASIIGIFIIIGIIAVVSSPEEEPVITPAEQAYAKTISDQSGTVAKAFLELGDLLPNPQMGNDEWTLQVATQLVIIRTVYDEAMELDPPNSMAEIHLKYIQGMKHYNEFTNLAAQGVDELDLSLLEQAIAEMVTGTQFTNEATKLIIEFSLSRGG